MSRDSKTIFVRQCEELTNFLMEKVPTYITVDEPHLFVDTAIDWLRWLCRQPGLLNNAQSIEGELKELRRPAIDALASAKGSASKMLVLEALADGVDVADNDAMVEHLAGHYYGVDYVEEFVRPPHPILKNKFSKNFYISNIGLIEISFFSSLLLFSLSFINYFVDSYR